MQLQPYSQIVDTLPAVYTFTFKCRDEKVITLALPMNAAGDEALIRSWLFARRSPKTQQSYAREIERFYSIVGCSVVDIRHVDQLHCFLQYASIVKLKASSQARALAAVKSLLTYASSAAVGALPINVGVAVQLPRIEDTLAERIMSEQSVDDMIRMEPDARNQAMLELLYFGALRVEELCNLKWRHLQERDQSGQIAVFGKGQKMRYVLLDADTWLKVWSLRKTSQHDQLDDYVFTSRQAKFKKDEEGKKVRTDDYSLDPRRVHQIVNAAAGRAGIAIYEGAERHEDKQTGQITETPVSKSHVSPHWLRHAHATHALDHGAPISLVSATLGHASVSTTGRYLHVRPNASSALGLRDAQKKRSSH